MVKAYWKEFFENLAQENIFEGGTLKSPFAKGVTTAARAERLQVQPEALRDCKKNQSSI